MTKADWWWLPNFLTFSRIFVAAVVFWAATQDQWVLACVLYLLALITDFLDGLAAKKLDAMTKFGANLDRWADASINGFALFGLAAGGVISWWLVVVIGVFSTFLAVERFFVPKHGQPYELRPLLSVINLTIVWVAIGMLYLTQAFGWSWFYIPLSIVIVVGISLKKRHRFRAWMGKKYSQVARGKSSTGDLPDTRIT